MEQLESKKQKNLKEKEYLTELRDWLLPMLMIGQMKLVIQDIFWICC